MRSLILFATLALSAHAGVHYTASGIFAPTVPVSYFTAPNQPWSIAFATDLNPVPITSAPTYFSVPFSGFAYTLNGSGLVLTPAEIIFYTSADGGGYVVGLTVLDQFSFTAPQMFTGSTASPTMLYGTFTSFTHDLDYLMVDGSFAGSLAGTNLYASTPEPGSIVLAGCGVLGLLAMRRRSRRSPDRN